MVFMREISDLFKAVSDRTRLRILWVLRKNPMCVCEIQQVLRLATSTVSTHLAILRRAGFILDLKEGKWVNYRRNDDATAVHVQQILTWVDAWLQNDQVAKKDDELASKANRYKICSP
jgi:ArsR family transcriptional regulator, arsenate/arsenite/antimonite-responsive transcriptional repressor